MSTKEENPTTDLTRFGYRELKEAGTLIIAYADNPPDCLGDGVQVWLNTNSGYVFLCDEDSNVAMMNGNRLEQWFSCPICGYEGFKADMQHEGDEECKAYLKEISVM